MDLVVDANVIFSALIKESRAYELLFDDALHLFVPEFFFSEFEEHKGEIIKKSQKTDEDHRRLVEIVAKRIVIVPLEEILPYLSEAENICPDPDDVAYFALALKLKCGIWSQDKALKQQNKIAVYSVEDLTRLLMDENG